MKSPDTKVRSISFARLITTCIGMRLLIDIGAQMFNPFLPIFAAGLNIDVVAMGRLVGLRNATGIFAPVFGSIADRRGYRIVMSSGLLASAAGMAVIGASSGVVQTAIGMILIGLGGAAFVPTLLAYLGARLPYHEVARGIGMLEYSWALTGIVGLSLMGLLIAATNWRVPFFVLAAGFVGAFFAMRTLPSAREEESAETSGQEINPRPSGFQASLREIFVIDFNRRSAFANLAATGFTYFGAMLIMIIYGVWMEDQFGFGPSQLGIVAFLFGCFDLVGSVCVSLFTDRFGKRRSVILGATGALISYLAIPFLSFAAIPAVLGTAVSRGFFEFAIVANITLLNGQVPVQRAKVMTISAAITLSFSTIASFTAPALYEHISITGITAISAFFTAVALILLVTRVKENVPPVIISQES
jgi:predicted MFS family arabinose efflux permease